MLDRRISGQHSDCEVLADLLDPTALQDRTEPERNRFIEALGGYLGCVLNSFGIADRDAAGTDRHSERVAYSLSIRSAEFWTLHVPSHIVQALSRRGFSRMSRTFRSLLGRAAFLFALLFTTAAAAQYLFLRWKLTNESKSYLQDSAKDMRNQIAFVDAWDLRGYRRWSGGPSTYVVMAQNGTLIDTYGYLRSMIPHNVSLPFAVPYDHPTQFSSDVGEDWILYVHELRDGIVVLGTRKDTAPEGINTLFGSNAERFGANVADALRTQERTIDEAFDYAVLDANGVLLRAIGGIPLKASPPAIPQQATLVPVNRIQDKMYVALLDPLVSKSRDAVGLISVFEDVTDDQHLLRQSAIFNGAVVILLWLATVAFAAAYLRRTRPSAISCSQIPFLDEGETVEFKSSLRWDYVKQKANPDLERVVVKTIVGFLNSENGGTLIIGMSDGKQVLGLEADYASFKTTKPDRDGFELRLHSMLISAIGESRCTRYIKPHFCSLHGKELCIITVAPASEPVFLEQEDQLYVRVGNSTRPFGVQEALDYSRDRWPLVRPHSRRPDARH